jgi:hypothetical protein
VRERERERETKRLLSALPNVGHQILHISGAGIISRKKVKRSSLKSIKTEKNVVKRTLATSMMKYFTK